MLKISKVLDWFLNVFSLIPNNSLPRVKYKLFEWNMDTDELVFNSLFDLFIFISKSCIRLSKSAIYFGGKYYLHIGWYESFSINHKKLVNEICLDSINLPIYDLLKEIAASIQHTGINNIVINKDGYIKISKMLKYDVSKNNLMWESNKGSLVVIEDEGNVLTAIFNYLKMVCESNSSTVGHPEMSVSDYLKFRS
jgi:hypothetical protein|nr:MAG TPA: hypothetical protein [Caudoviricetes sp.]